MKRDQIKKLKLIAFGFLAIPHAYQPLQADNQIGWIQQIFTPKNTIKFGKAKDSITARQLEDRIKKNPAELPLLIEIAAQNITHITLWQLKVLLAHPQALIPLTEAAAQHLAAVSPESIKLFIKRDRQAIALFADAIANHNAIMSIPHKTFKLIIDKASDKEKSLIQEAIRKQNNGTLFDIFIRNANAALFGRKILTNDASQSAQHLLRNTSNIVEKFSEHIGNNKDLQKMLRALYTKEKEEQAKGNYTFVHAQKWQWHFFADVFKKLWEIKYKQIIQNYHFLRFYAQEDINLAAESALRESIMLNGRTNKNRSLLLFMNHAIFGNTNESGSCSAEYFIGNYDLSNIDMKIEELFTILGMQNLYESYAQELEDLKELHEEASSHGNLLLISLTPEQIKKSVYVAAVGGSKRTVNIRDEEIDDVTIILDTLRQHPEYIDNSDEIEYCMALTKDFTLDPQQGPRIYTFNIANKEKLAAYENARNQICEKIRADFILGFSARTPKGTEPQILITPQPQPSMLTKAQKAIVSTFRNNFSALKNGLTKATQKITLKHVIGISFAALCFASATANILTAKELHPSTILTSHITGGTGAFLAGSIIRDIRES